MTTIQNIQTQLEAIKAPILVDVARILLGSFIVFKGIQFTMDFESIIENLGSMTMILLVHPLAYYIIFFHVIGGALIVLGAYTRAMSLLNIPILLGAVIFNSKTFLTTPDFMELSTAIIVLVLLVVIFIYGSGKYSFEEIRRKREARKEAE